MRSAHNKLSQSQKSCQIKGEQSQVWLVRTCGGNGYTIDGAVFILQGVLGLSQDERSSQKSHQRGCGKTSGKYGEGCNLPELPAQRNHRFNDG